MTQLLQLPSTLGPHRGHKLIVKAWGCQKIFYLYHKSAFESHKEQNGILKSVLDSNDHFSIFFINHWIWINPSQRLKLIGGLNHCLQARAAQYFYSSSSLPSHEYCASNFWHLMMTIVIKIWIFVITQCSIYFIDLESLSIVVVVWSTYGWPGLFSIHRVGFYTLLGFDPLSFLVWPLASIRCAIGSRNKSLV